MSLKDKAKAMAAALREDFSDLTGKVQTAAALGSSLPASAAGGLHGLAQTFMHGGPLPTDADWEKYFLPAQKEAQDALTYVPRDSKAKEATQRAADVLGLPAKYAEKGGDLAMEHGAPWWAVAPAVTALEFAGPGGEEEAAFRRPGMAETAFRHFKTKEVVPSGIMHDPGVLPTGMMTNEFMAGPSWEEGFLNHQGDFLNRREAAKAVGLPSHFAELDSTDPEAMLPMLTLPMLFNQQNEAQSGPQ